VLPPDETIKEIEASRTGSVCILRYRFSTCSWAWTGWRFQESLEDPKWIYTRPPTCEIKASHPYQEELSQINLAAFPNRFSKDERRNESHSKNVFAKCCLQTRRLRRLKPVGQGVSVSYDTDSQLALGHQLDGNLRKAWKILKGIYTRPPTCEMKVSHPYQEELNQINLAAFPNRFSKDERRNECHSKSVVAKCCLQTRWLRRLKPVG